MTYALSAAPASTTGKAAVLSARGISKWFGPVTALAGVDFDLYPGEIVALVGDNGAGKSTFVSVLSGVTTPDTGSIAVDGQEVVLSSPQRAHALGISTVFQNLALVEARDVAANLFLGREPRRLGFIVDRRRMVREATETIARLKVSLPSVRALTGQLSGGQRQAVAIARAVMQGGRVIIMDEPTAALGVRESRRVIDLVGELRAEGHTVLLVSHNMENVFELADRVAVFRLGRKIAERRREEFDRQEIVGLIVHGGLI
jgi:ABC-type sugar transport system ATPase subunit